MSERPLSDFPLRVLTALAYGAIVLGVLLFGRLIGWAVLVAVAAALALSEFYALTRKGERRATEAFGLLATVAMPIATAIHGTLGLTAIVTALVLLSLLLHLAFRRIELADTAVGVFGVVYVGYTLAHLVLLRSLDSGTIFVLATLASVWLNDSMAYIVGTTLGRTKLAPRVSPNKTWEGFLAGTVASVAVWWGVWAVTDTGVSLAWHLAIGFALAIADLVGDLAESRVKREVGAKDSGRLMPGHGGFLDRLDALMVVGVVAYYLLVWAGAR